MEIAAEELANRRRVPNDKKNDSKPIIVKEHLSTIVGFSKPVVMLICLILAMLASILVLQIIDLVQ